MRITGRQLRQIIKEEVTRSLMREEDTGGLSAARELEMEPFMRSLPTLPDGSQVVSRPFFVKGLYADAGKRLVDSAARLVSHLSSITDGASDAKTGSLMSNMTAVVLNRPNGQSMRQSIKSDLSSNTNDDFKFLAIVYTLATGKPSLEVSNNTSPGTIMMNANTMLTSLGLDAGAGMLEPSLDDLYSYMGTTSFVDDLSTIVTRTPPANLK